MQKSMEAAMVARETFPDTWSAADKKQAERDQKLLLASLERCQSGCALPTACTCSSLVSTHSVIKPELLIKVV